MKRNAVIVIMSMAVIGLAIGLMKLNQKAAEQKKAADSTIVYYSNEVTQVRGALEEQRAVNLTLETNLAVTKLDYSNKLVAAEANLSNTAAALSRAQSEAKAAAEAAAAEIAQRDKKINELELQNQSLDKQALDLRLSITNLEGQITIVQNKLNASEGDRKYLLKELERLRTEKADLEKKFNDLEVLRAQVRKLKEEMAISKRLDMLRRGVYESLSQKGAERLRPMQVKAVTNQHDLNVEVRQDGGVRIQPASMTNSPVSK